MSEVITPGGNPVCPKCGRWYGLGVEHVCDDAVCCVCCVCWAGHMCYMPPSHDGPHRCSCDATTSPDTALL